MVESRKFLGLQGFTWIALGAGVVVLALGLRLFQLPHEMAAPKAGQGAKPFVSVARLGGSEAADTALRDQVNLFDPTPLFVPTEWNSEQRGLPPEIERRPGEVFAPFSPKLSFAETELALKLSPPMALPGSPVEVMVQEMRDPFLGFGRVDLTLPALESRGAFVEVVALGAEQPALRAVLADAHPPRADWAPLEFWAAVNSAGLLGQLVLIPHLGLPGEGSEEIDAYFRDFLAEEFRIGERLEPGFYRVIVGH